MTLEKGDLSHLRPVSRVGTRLAQATALLLTDLEAALHLVELASFELRDLVSKMQSVRAARAKDSTTFRVKPPSGLN